MSYSEGFADENELNSAILQTIGEVDALYKEVGKLQESWRDAFGPSSSREAPGRYGDFIWGALTTNLNYDDIDEDFFFADLNPPNTDEETVSVQPEEIIPEQDGDADEPIIQDNTLPQPDVKATNAGSSRTVPETPSSETQSINLLKFEIPLFRPLLGLKRANSTPLIQEMHRTGTLAKEPIQKDASCKRSEHMRPWLESNASSLIKSSDTVDSNSPDSKWLQPIKAVRLDQQSVDSVARNGSPNRLQKKASHHTSSSSELKNEPGIDSKNRVLESNISASTNRKIPMSVSWFFTGDALEETESTPDLREIPRAEDTISVNAESLSKMDECSSDVHEAEAANNDNIAGSSCGAAKKAPSAFWLDLKTSGKIPSLIPLPRWRRRSSNLFFSDSSSTIRHNTSTSTNNSQEEGPKRPWLESNASALVETTFTSCSNSLTTRRQIEDRMSAPVRPVSHNNPLSSDQNNLRQKNNSDRSSSSPHITKKPQRPRIENC